METKTGVVKTGPNGTVKFCWFLCYDDLAIIREIKREKTNLILNFNLLKFAGDAAEFL